MSYISMDNELDYKHPFLVLSDNNNICQTWGNALQNSNFVDNTYNKFSEEDQKKIKDNLKNRTCQMIDNVNQCFTTNGLLETCKKLPDEHPKSIREIMTKIDTMAQNKKNEMLVKLTRVIEKKRLQIDSLINQYASRKTMISMNQGFKTITTSSINKNQELKNDLGHEIDDVDNLKEFATNDNKIIRNTMEWYSYKNNIIKITLKVLLCFMVFINFLFILTIRLN
jgi:hypothetical protein